MDDTNLKFRVKGHVNLIPHDAITGEILENEIQEMDNLTVTNGYALLVACLLGQETISYNGTGSGTTAAALTDTDLEIPIGSRKVITDTVRSGAVALFSTFYTSSDNNGSWAESVLAVASTGDDTIIARVLFSNLFIKDNTKTAQIDWTITFSEVT